MQKRLVLSAVVLASFAFTSCSRFFIKKDSFSEVKKAALVQYAINPHMLLGTVSSDEARVGTADANVKTFVEKMNGKPYEVMSLDEMKSKPGYAAGKDKLEGYYTANGMRFFTDESGASKAELPPDVAKKLCEDLGVDAVAIAYDSWGQVSTAMGFKAKAKPVTFVNMYDKTGTRVWGDVESSESEDSMAAPGGIIATDVATVVKTFNQSFSTSMDEFGKRIATAK